MDPNHWQRVKRIFQSAIERPPQDRDAFLDQACSDNPTLREEVESLIASQEKASNSIEIATIEMAAEKKADSIEGKLIGPYKVLSQIGSGGMGEVYLAHDTRLGRRIALKLLRKLTTDQERLRRFRQEARTVSALNHPNILTIYDIGEADGLNFMATEYVEGKTFRQLISRAEMTVGQLVDVATQVANALAATHGVGIIHRDIKPENLMLRPDGYVKVLDFGVAKLTERMLSATTITDLPTAIQTEPGSIVGTVHYMSPEQARGLDVDGRTDIFSLGVVLYEMIAGRSPFVAATAGDVIALVIAKEPRPLIDYSPELPAELTRIVSKALVKDREARYQTAEHLLSDLRNLKEKLTVEAKQLPLKSTSGPSTHVINGGTNPRNEGISVAGSRNKWTRTHRWAAIAGTTIVLILAIIFGRFLIKRSSQEPVAAEKITLAVVPFRAVSAQEEIAFLEVGIPDSVITRLANVQQMRVRPTSAILRYLGQNVDSSDVGKALKTDYVASGTVQTAGDRLRVSVQLYRVSDGTLIWGQSYDRTRSDLISLQDDISKQVAEALKIRMTAAEQARFYRRYTENAAAYESYLQGRSHLLHQTQTETTNAIRLFEKALELDRNYALAHAGLAVASGRMRIRFAPESEVKRWENRAKDEAAVALGLDPDLAEAHEALAAVYRDSDFDWERTIVESDRALERNPNLEYPHYYRAAAFYHLGLMDLVDREVRAGLEINPGNHLEPLRARAVSLIFGGSSKEAIPLLEEAREMSASDVTDWYLALACYYDGQSDRAEKILGKLRGSDSAQAEQRAKATLASFFAERGNKREAKELLREVTAGAYMDHHVAYSIGAAYAQLRENGNALRWMKSASETGFPCYPWYEKDRLLAPILGDPPFHRFMNDLRSTWQASKARYAQ